MVPLALTLALSTNTTVSVNSANCAHPDVPAAVSEVLFSGVPSVADAADEHGVTKLRITLAAKPGTPQKVIVEISSGLLAVDSLAMQFAQHTTFTPEVQGCTAIAGDYFYEVEN